MRWSISLLQLCVWCAYEAMILNEPVNLILYPLPVS